MDTVAQLRAFPHSKKLRKSGRQRASFLNRSSRVEEVAFCPPCSLGSSNKCTRVPALCRGLVLSLMYKEDAYRVLHPQILQRLAEVCQIGFDVLCMHDDISFLRQLCFPLSSYAILQHLAHEGGLY